MTNKIKKAYQRSSDSNLMVIAHRISESMKSNPNFPNPVPSQVDFEKACRELQLAVSVAGRNDRTLSSAKNDKKAELIRLLNQLAGYVTVASNGDRTKLLSSGFDITGVKGEAQALSPITALVVEIGPPGQAISKVKRVTGSRAYLHQYTRDPVNADSQWVSETVTDNQYTFTDLQSVTRYWFRVVAIGKGKQSVHSPLVSRVIQ
jgi:hypothetical protein